MPRQLLHVAVPAIAALFLAGTAAAQGRPGPRALGTFQSWTAATAQENGQKVCYAFARAARSEGAPGNRGPVTLTVTHRPNGRDQVALSVGYALGRAAESELAVGNQEFKSYAVVQTSAFFQNGGQLVAALRNGRDAVAKTPPPSGRGAVTDSFPLSGFSAAYEAISRECPAQARAGR